MAGGAERLPIVAHCLGPIASHLGRAAAAEAKLRTLDLDLIHDIGVGWHCDILQSEDGSRIAMWERRLKLLPPWLRGIKRQMISVLPRYRAFRQLMDRQFGDPERIVVAISKMCARDFQQYHGVSPSGSARSTTASTSSDSRPGTRERHREPVRDRLGIGQEEVVFLFVGHDHRRKGLATPIRAVERLTRGGVPARLLVVGGGRRGTAFCFLPQRRTARRGLRGPGRRSGPYYAAADAFVLPTFYDPCGLSRAGGRRLRPARVTSRSTGASELLSEGVDGYVLADPADDRQWAAAWRDCWMRRCGDGWERRPGDWPSNIPWIAIATHCLAICREMTPTHRRAA